MIIEFLVDDVDGVHQDLAGFVGDFVAEPTTLPWGNRSLLLRDPDGDLVSFFTPHPGRHRKVRSVTHRSRRRCLRQKPRDPKIPVPRVTRAGWPPSTADPAGPPAYVCDLKTSNISRNVERLFHVADPGFLDNRARSGYT